MEESLKSKNKRMAIKISKYKELRYFDMKVSFKLFLSFFAIKNKSTSYTSAE